MRRIVLHDKHVVILCLFYRQVGLCMLQFRGEGNAAVTGNGIEVFAQIIGELSKLSSYIKQRIIINRIHFTLQEEEIHN